MFFWTLFQINSIILTNNSNSKQILTNLRRLLEEPMSISLDEKQEIIQSLNDIKAENGEELYNNIFSLYKNLELETKEKIKFSSSTNNEHEKERVTLKNKLDLLIKKKANYNIHVDEEEKCFRKTLSSIMKTTRLFIELLIEIEDLFIGRFQLLSLGEEKNYHQKIKSFEEKLTKKIEIINRTWNDITSSEYYDENIKIKQKILISTESSWDYFKNSIYSNPIKRIVYNIFVSDFYHTAKTVLINENKSESEKVISFSELSRLFKETPEETGKGDIFQQLEKLDTLEYFELDLRIEYGEKKFYSLVTSSFKDIYGDYNKIITLIPKLIATRHKIIIFSHSEETDIPNDILSLLDSIMKKEEFLLNAINRPAFLVVELERVRQILNKLGRKKSFGTKSRLLSAFGENALQKDIYLFSFEKFSLAEKLMGLLSKSTTDKIGLKPFKHGPGVLRSALARFEYYLTFPFILSEDKESLVSPEKGVAQYCQSVFGSDGKENRGMGLCSKKAETFPLIKWAELTSAFTKEQTTTKTPTPSSKNNLFQNFMIIFVLVIVVLGFGIFVFKLHNYSILKKRRKGRFTNKQKRKGYRKVSSK